MTPRILQLPSSVRLKVREIARFAATLAPETLTVAGIATFALNGPRDYASGPNQPDYDLPILAQPPRRSNSGPKPGKSVQPPATILQLIDPTTALTTEGVCLRTTLKLPFKALNLRISASSADKVLLVTPRLSRLVLAICDGGRVRFWHGADGVEIPCSLNTVGLISCGERLVVKQSGALYEVRRLELPTMLQPMLHPVANVLPHATRLFDDVAVQDILGAYHVSLFPQPGTCRTVRIPDLDGHRILDARFDNNVLMVASEQAGKYVISILRFGVDYRDYDLRAVPDAASPDIGFVTLDNGVCLWLNPRQELKIFSNRKGASSLKVLDEPALHGARLFMDGTQALFARGDTLYEMKMGT